MRFPGATIVDIKHREAAILPMDTGEEPPEMPEPDSDPTEGREVDEESRANMLKASPGLCRPRWRR